MFRTTQITRIAAVGATIATLGSAAAQARQGDVPLRPVETTHTAQTSERPATRSWSLPRTESPGVRPTHRIAAVDVRPVPLTADGGDGGPAWPLIAVLTVGLVAPLAAGAMLRGRRSGAHPFRTPRW